MTLAYCGLQNRFTTTRGMIAKPRIGTTVTINEQCVEAGVRVSVVAVVTVVGIVPDCDGDTVYVVKGLPADCNGYFRAGVCTVFVEGD